MLESLRKTPFFIAMILLGLILLVEVGTAVAIPFVDKAGDAVGSGIPALALLDAQLVFTALLMAAPLIFPQSVTGRIQGIATVVVALVLIIAGIMAGLAAFSFLTYLVGLLTIHPAGLPIYASSEYHLFPNNLAATTLGFIMSCKLGSVAALVVAHQRFLENKGFMLLIGTSLLATVIISFLHGFVPGPLVTVTDVFGALVVVVLALIWAVLGLIFGAISVYKALA